MRRYRQRAVVSSWLFPPRGPDDALVRFRDGPHAFVKEALDALPAIRLGCIDVAFRIGRDAVDAVEFAGLASAIPEAGEHFERVAIDDVHLVVFAVRDVEELLLRVVGKGDVPDRSRAEGLFLDHFFLHESAVWFEDLDTVVNAIADVEESVVRELCAVDRIAELLRGR